MRQFIAASTTKQLLDEQIVHNLEHGNVVISHNLTDPGQLDELEAVAKGLPGRNRWLVMHSYLGLNVGQVAIAAWGVVAKTFDGVDPEGLEEFYNAHFNSHGPESVVCFVKMFLARIYITLKPTVNDPQGQTVLGGLWTMGFTAVDGVRIGKYLEVKVSTVEPRQAEEQVKEMCHQLLANPVIEDYRFELEEVNLALKSYPWCWESGLKPWDLAPQPVALLWRVL